MLYGITAKESPRIRSLIDKIKSVNALPDLKVMLSGGVFERAEGLWEEIGADMYASNAAEAVKIASADDTDLTVPRRTIKRRKKVVTEKIEGVELAATTT